MMRYDSIFPALMDIDSNEIPIFIPTFNQPSLLKMTLEELAGFDGKIVIYDNNSTFPAMVRFLDEVSKEFMVIRSTVNTGPRILTEDIHILQLMPDYFLVSDPDLIYNANLPQNFLKEMKKVIADYNLAKVGFALEINDEDERARFQDYDKVYEWEHHYWENQIGLTSTKDRIFDAWIDTTFSLNSKRACLYHRKFGKPTFRYPSARIADKYACQHVGWWKKDLIPQTNEEKTFYLTNQKWSHTENYYYR